MPQPSVCSLSLLRSGLTFSLAKTPFARPPSLCTVGETAPTIADTDEDAISEGQLTS